MDIQKELERELSFAPEIETIFADNAGRIQRSGFNIFKFAKSSAMHDSNNGFDFILQMGNVTVPVRIRKPDCRYRDFTIRSRARAGGKTEIHKIGDGAGDIYFYAWTKNVSGAEKITEWIMVNMDAFRQSGLMDIERRDIDNGDGTKFRSFGVKELDAFNCIIARMTNGAVL